MPRGDCLVSSEESPTGLDDWHSIVKDRGPTLRIIRYCVRARAR